MLELLSFIYASAVRVMIGLDWPIQLKSASSDVPRSLKVFIHTRRGEDIAQASCHYTLRPPWLLLWLRSPKWWLNYSHLNKT